MGASNGVVVDGVRRYKAFVRDAQSDATPNTEQRAPTEHSERTERARSVLHKHRGKAPAYQLYAADFLAATDLMSAEELSVYARFRAYYWQQHAIEYEPKKLAQLLRVSPNRFSRIWPALERHFPLVDGLVTCPDLDYQRARHREMSEARSRAARSRWDAERVQT